MVFRLGANVDPEMRANLALVGVHKPDDAIRFSGGSPGFLRCVRAERR